MKRNFKKYKWLYIITAILLAAVIALYVGISIIKDMVKQWPGELPQTNLYVQYKGEEYEYNSELLNILLLGVDQFKSLDDVADSVSGGFADAIFLLTINTRTKDWGVTIIPRDTMTDIIRTDYEGNEVGTQEFQITYQYVTGKSAVQSSEFMKRTVSNLLHDIPIHRFCTLNFSAIPIINDMIGGVEVKVEEDLAWGVPEFVQGETVHLMGENARQYISMRNTNIHGSNLLRIERQKQYLEAFFEKAKKAVDKNFFLVPRIYKELEKNLCTDLSYKEILYLAELFTQLSFDETKLHQIEGEQKSGTVFEEFYPDEEALQEHLIETFFKKKEPFSADSVQETESTVPTEIGQQESLEEELYPNDIDFESLQKLNSDIYGWIRIPGTNIDHPLLSHEQDGYYLDYLYNGQKGSAGAIFTDKYNAKDMTDPVTVIYGHNMNKSGTMFSQLHKYAEEAFLQEYPYVYIYLPEETLKYKIFLAASGDDRYLLAAYDFSKEEGLQQYLSALNASEKKVSDDSISVAYLEPVIVLSTCFSEYPDERWLVNAKLIQREGLKK